MACLLGAATLMAPAASSAATILFTADRAHIAILNPPNTGRCAPTWLATVTIVPGASIPTSTGSSTLGTFQSTQSHCIVTQPPTPFVEGLFSYAFASGDLLLGTYSGAAGPTGVPDTFSWSTTLIVTGGTGLFAGATGTLSETGTFVRKANPAGPGFVQDYSGRVSGLLGLPAVPEPATWAMLIAGFALAGGALRERPRRALMPA